MPRQLLQEILLNTDSSPYEDDGTSLWKHISISITDHKRKSIKEMTNFNSFSRRAFKGLPHEIFGYCS